MSRKQKRTKSNKDPFADREARKYEQPIASREFILQKLKEYKSPGTFKALSKILGIRKAEKKEALKHRLSAMVRDGQLIKNRRDEYLPVNDRDLIRGRVIAHADGYGFLKLDEGGDDLFIPAHQMRALLHGDRVVMRVTDISRRGKKEVALIEVLERANQRVVGRLHVESGIAFVVADNKRIHQDILIPDQNKKDAIPGQIVIAEIIEQPTFHRQPIGRISEVLGDHMAPGMEIEVAINSHGLPFEWPDEVTHEICEYNTVVNDNDLQGRNDYRQLPFVTIDGEDAKDFDDAVYSKKTQSGWQLLVAIADVSQYVQPGCAIDNEAYRRGTSVYFPGQVLPMLPEVLSNELCSLKPNVDRLCVVCEMSISHEGELKSYKFTESVIHSHARLTYTEVSEFINNSFSGLADTDAAVIQSLKQLYGLYKVLRKIRNRRGAIDFDSSETQIIFSESQKIEAIKPVIRNDAHCLIEECMILANIAAARFITKNKIPNLYRVHEPPADEKIEDLKQFLGGLGITFAIKQQPNAKSYANLLKKIKQRPDSHLIETVLLRSLAQAVYTPDNAGHFGLALSHYAHFTSPIRRYPDLLLHRAIRHLIHKNSVDSFTYSASQMHIMGEHCSMTERRADEATRDAIDWLKCEYMLDKVGQVFNGIISGVTSFGLFVELDDVYIEGLIHITSLQNDFYHFDPISHTLSGERTKLTYRLADSIRVKVVRVDLDDKEIDLDPVLASKKKK